MSDFTPSTNLEGQHGDVIHTHAWQIIAHFYRERIAAGVPIEPLLRLVEAIGSSVIASQLFGAISLFDLLLSNTGDFGNDEGPLRISYRANEHQFEFRYRTFSGHEDRETSSESDALSTLKVLLRLKFGMLFEPLGV
jgi:hypothetical protein